MQIESLELNEPRVKKTMMFSSLNHFFRDMLLGVAGE